MVELTNSVIIKIITSGSCMGCLDSLIMDSKNMFKVNVIVANIAC